MSLARRLVPAALRPHARNAWRKGQRLLVDLRRSLDHRALTEAQFIEELRRFGVESGGTLYVHSSMDELSRRVPGLTPLRLVAILEELLGCDGTLLAPTFPFAGLQYAWARDHREFNVRRTPSMMGLFTEVFRRSPGVVRSLHPTHPIAAWGRRAEELLAEHHLGSAFGRTSPVYKMQAHRGRVLGLGVTPKRCYTLYHIAEDLHPKSHAIHYGPDAFDMTIVNGAERVPHRVTPLRPDLVRRYDRAEEILIREGILRFENVSGLRLNSAAVEPFLKRSLELIEEDRFYPTLIQKRKR